MTLESCVVDLKTGIATGTRGESRLAPQLVALLSWFADRPGEPVSRQRLLEELWGFHPNVVSRAADVAVRRLRTHIEADPAHPRHLVSIRGVGWAFEPLELASTPLQPPAPSWPDCPSLLGRGGELDALARLTNKPGLVTLHGPPGVGKSALASHVGGATEARWWVSLDGVGSEEAFFARITQALRVTVPPGASAREVIGRALTSVDRAHVVLDGADALVSFLAERLPIWLDTLPALTLVLTSREALRIREETTLSVRPLDGASSAALFEARGGPDGEHTPALLTRLDGLPLAIELAAERCSIMPPASLLDRFELDLLASRRRDVQATHRTLRAAIGVSWNPLTPTERLVLAGCGAFADGAGLAAVEELLVEVVPHEPVLDVMQRLVEKSLLRTFCGRVHTLACVSEFALQQLDAALRQQIMRRHAEVILRRAEPLLEGHIPPDGTGMAADLDLHVADLLRIEDRFPDDALGARATAVISPRRANMAGASDATRRFEAARAVGGLDDDARARLIVSEAFLLSEWHRVHEAEALLDSLPRGASPMWTLAADAVRTSNRVRRRSASVDETRALLARLRGTPHQRWRLHCELDLAECLFWSGSMAEARRHATIVLGLARTWGDRNFEGRAHLTLARFALITEDWHGGLAPCRQALEAFEQQPIDRFRMFTHEIRGNLLVRLGRHAEAEDAFVASIHLADQLGGHPRKGQQLTWLATVRGLQGNWARAEQDLHDARALCSAYGDQAGVALAESRLGVVEHLNGRLEVAAQRYQLALRGVPDALTDAKTHLHVMLSAVRLTQGRIDEAVEHLATASRSPTPATRPYLAIAQLHLHAVERGRPVDTEALTAITEKSSNTYLDVYARLVLDSVQRCLQAS